MFSLDFWADFYLVVLLLLFFLIYNYLNNEFVRSPFVALVLTAVIVFVLVEPYQWFAYLLFVVLFLGAAFEKIKPAEW